jgi:hypothetical protein
MQLRPCGRHTSRSSTLLCSADTSRCSSGPVVLTPPEAAHSSVVQTRPDAAQALWQTPTGAVHSSVVQTHAVLGSIPASSDTVESGGRQMKQCCIPYLERISSLFGVTLLFFSRLTPNDMIFMSGVTPNTIS